MQSLTTLTTPLNCLDYNEKTLKINFPVFLILKITTQSLTQNQGQASIHASE